MPPAAMHRLAAMSAALVASATAPVASAAPLPALAACGGGGFRVDPKTTRFVDACGRERLFRGINKVRGSRGTDARSVGSRERAPRDIHSRLTGP